MFEEICLVCGKYLDDDARAYCSEDCLNLDTSSPSISSASSVVSSPNTGYAPSTDLPTLVPSALTSALHKYSRTRYYHSVSSSSASSTSWSVATDDEDDPYTKQPHYYPHDSTDSFHGDSPKSYNFLETLKPSALSYARRPSEINNRSTVPNPTKTHSRSTSTHVRDVPRSAPLRSRLSPKTSANDDLGFSSRDESESELHVTKSLPASKHKRNRASLPSYFSLLQISTVSDGKHISPVSSTSGNNTVARPSPPTPKIPLAGLTHSSSTIHATPRGRRRTQAVSTTNRYAEDSNSRSPPRSRTRRGPPPPQQQPSCSRDHQADDQHLASAPIISRGRPTVRRNNSPPPEMMLLPTEDQIRATATDAHHVDGGFTMKTESTLLSGFRRARGRATADVDADAPGFGQGRSGLLDRGRRMNRAQ